MVSYYAICILFFEETWQYLQYSELVTSGAIFVDYFAFCVLTTVVSLYYWRSSEKTEKERYRLLTNEKVLVKNDAENYCVTIPIIKAK